MTDRLSELAKALADASDRLNGTNHRDDQRLMEEVATRIQARVDDYDAAYAALEAYGLEKASEGAVKVPVAVSGLNVVVDAGLDDDVEVSVPIGVGTDPHLGNVRGQSFEFAADSNGIEPPADYLRTYSNGLDAHNEE